MVTTAPTFSDGAGLRAAHQDANVTSNLPRRARSKPDLWPQLLPRKDPKEPKSSCWATSSGIACFGATVNWGRIVKLITAYTVIASAAGSRSAVRNPSLTPLDSNTTIRSYFLKRRPPQAWRNCRSRPERFIPAYIIASPAARPRLAKAARSSTRLSPILTSLREPPWAI